VTATGRVLPTDIIKAAVVVSQISQCPLLRALRTGQIKKLLSPLADEQSLPEVTLTVRSWPRAAYRAIASVRPEADVHSRL